MKLKIETLITKDVNAFQAGNGRVFNQIYGDNYSSEFKVSSFNTQEIELETSNQIDLSDFIQDFSKISSIIVFCVTSVQNPEDNYIPILFETIIDSVSFKQSQLSLVNCDLSNVLSLVFDNFEIPADKKALLTLAISKK